MKICSKCKITKNLDDFSHNKHYKDGKNIYCKPCRVKLQRQYFLRRPETQRAYKRKWTQENRYKVLLHYCDGNIKCAKCPYTDIRALSIDHINNDGSKHRKQVGHNYVYRWIIKNNFPSGFQVLCMNCQFIKEYERNQDCIRAFPTHLVQLQLVQHSNGPSL